MDPVLKKLPLLILLCCYLFILSCKGEPQPKTAEELISGGELKILCLQGFSEHARPLISNFEREYATKVILQTVPASVELIDSLYSNNLDKSFDLVIGLDNAFLQNLDPEEHFLPVEGMDGFSLNPDCYMEKGNRLIPYGYSHLAIAYDTHSITTPPESFGELQDSKYYNQLGLCDPAVSGFGRSVLFWSLALFGDAGYEQLWRSLRKNVLYTYPDWDSSLKGIEKGECKLIFANSATAAWTQAQQKSSLNLEVSTLKEGSFLYVEYASVPISTSNQALAQSFIRFLLSPPSQTLLSSRLGLFPANNKASLPAAFNSIPFSTYTVNERLKKQQIRENLPSWLEAWKRVFYNSLSNVVRI
ncbi:MAG: thiamine ABC transporter substrate-binding protein [Candidatus Cloacimonetes bacterium]|nr:thiamine ABC transporter substrate-binding protein [Candidatus Cloacimonadota bacterium]